MNRRTESTGGLNIRYFILNELPELVPLSHEGFIDGPTPGETDFHVAAWLATIVACCMEEYNLGQDEAIDALEKELGELVPLEVERYWEAWTKRESWKVVYKRGVY